MAPLPEPSPRIPRPKGWSALVPGGVLHVIARAQFATTFRTQKVTLPNGLLVALDAEADGTLRLKRDEWLKTDLETALKASEGIGSPPRACPP